MSSCPTAITPEVHSYIQSHNPLPHPILDDVLEVTRQRTDAVMQVSPEQGAFMHLITKISGTKRALEIGCFTGYSAIATACGLPLGGQLITLDVNEETAAIAREFFRQARLAEVIDLRLGSALTTLDQLIASEGPGAFDQVFIDADKGNYSLYYEAALTLLKPGGLVMVDNTLWSGDVVNPDVNDADTLAIRALNELIQGDQRVESVMLGLGDGLTIARKR